LIPKDDGQDHKMSESGVIYYCRSFLINVGPAQKLVTLSITNLGFLFKSKHVVTAGRRGLAGRIDVECVMSSGNLRVMYRIRKESIKSQTVDLTLCTGHYKYNVYHLKIISWIKESAKQILCNDIYFFCTKKLYVLWC